MQLRGQSYDPDTCITVKQLREQGYEVPGHIPPDAWAVTKKIRMQIVGSERIGDKAHLKVRLLETQFRWAGQELPDE